jgi:hypothetical protein
MANTPDDHNEPLEDDVLLGARRIAGHLTDIFGVPVDETSVYYAHRRKKLPIGKYGAQLIARGLDTRSSVFHAQRPL